MRDCPADMCDAHGLAAPLMLNFTEQCAWTDVKAFDHDIQAAFFKHSRALAAHATSANSVSLSEQYMRGLKSVAASTLH